MWETVATLPRPTSQTNTVRSFPQSYWWKSNDLPVFDPLLRTDRDFAMVLRAHRACWQCENPKLRVCRWCTGGPARMDRVIN